MKKFVCRQSRGVPSREIRRASVLIYATTLLTALVGIAAFAVDFGRIKLVQTELQRAADAGARAGAAQLEAGDSYIQTDAARAAVAAITTHNQAANEAILLQAQDVEIGNWESASQPKFSTTRSPLNAVRVTPRRAQARGNPLPLSAASIFGISSWDVSATAVACVDPQTSPYGMVGIDWVRFSSLGTVAQMDGDLASNGDISVGYPLGLFVAVQGDARSYAGTVRRGTFASITGSTAPLSKRLFYPTVNTPTTNENSKISGYLDSNSNFGAALTATIPGGTYVVRNLDLLAGLQVSLQGPVTFYVTGNFNMAAMVNLFGQTSFDPSQFKVRVCNGGQVNFLGNLLTPLCMDLYAPESNISIGVEVLDYHGVIVGKSLDICLPVLSRFKEVRPAVVGDVSGQIRLVE